MKGRLRRRRQSRTRRRTAVRAQVRRVPLTRWTASDGQGRVARLRARGARAAARGAAAGHHRRDALERLPIPMIRAACAGAQATPSSCGRFTGSCCCTARTSLTRHVAGHRRRPESRGPSLPWSGADRDRDRRRLRDAARRGLGHRRFRAPPRDGSRRRCAAAEQAKVRGRRWRALLDEVAALVEWPVPLYGAFRAAFLELPREVPDLTLQEHQRYFPVADATANCCRTSLRSAISRAKTRRRSSKATSA